MIEITQTIAGNLTFKELQIGAVFKVPNDDAAYIKTHEINEINSLVNCVHLDRGAYAFVPEGNTVIPAKVARLELEF